MPQPKKGPRLGSNPSHQRLMMSNLAQSLFVHERIQTTEAKAKMLRPYAEKLITKAKKGGVHNRRVVLADIEDRQVVHKLFEDIAPRFADRNGGYTRILKLGPRGGDGAPMALVELVAEGRVTTVTEDEAESKRRRLRRGRRRPAGAEPQEEAAGPEEAEEPAAEEAADAGEETEEDTAEAAEPSEDDEDSEKS